MRKIWVFLLAAVAFGLGAFAALAYSGMTASFASFRIACELLNTAEGTGMLERAQRADVVDRVVREMQKSGSSADTTGMELVGQLRTGCPKLPNW